MTFSLGQMRNIYESGKAVTDACQYRPSSLSSPPTQTPVCGAAGIAQLVEQRIRNAKVGGSTPLAGTIFLLQKKYRS